MLTNSKDKSLGQQLQEAQAGILKRRLDTRFYVIRQALWDKVNKGAECQVRIMAPAKDEHELQLWADKEELYLDICRLGYTRFDIDVVLPGAPEASKLITVLIRPRS